VKLLKPTLYFPPHNYHPENTTADQSGQGRLDQPNYFRVNLKTGVSGNLTSSTVAVLMTDNTVTSGHCSGYG
jgi:hypothetical protein